MVSLYRPLLKDCIGGTDLLSDLGDVIDENGRREVRRAGKREGASGSMQVLLGLIDASPNQDKWEIFYKALKNNDFEHVITALKYEKIPNTVRKVYSELLLQPENIKHLHGLLSSDSQKKLVERNVLFNEDIYNISSEREKTESDTAAVLVLLDRLWRKNTKWIEELSNIFKSKDDVFSQKLFQYSTGAEETEPKEVSNVVKEDSGVTMTYVDRDRRQKAKSEQEETEPKTLLHTDAQLLHMASGTSESNRVTETESSPATFSTDVHENTRLSDLPERIGESLSTLHTEPCVGGSTHLSDLPKKVGESLSSLSSESCMRGSQEISISDPGEYISIESPREVHQNSAREVTTGEINQIGEVLDATVERSRLRNDSAMYRDEESEVSSDKDDGPRSEKDINEATEKETFPTLTMRNYQLELAEIALSGRNTIICAETGTGKTYVALYLTQQHLASKNDACVVFLARTNALVEQQYEKFSKFLYKYKVYHLKTDKTAAMGRKLVMAKENHQVFFMTPQILLNNINSKQISLQEVSLLILDECHHTRKREPYNNVMKQYLHLKRDSKNTSLPRVLGLTATIGVGKSSTLDGAVSHILSVCASLDVLDISMVKNNKEELESHVAIPKRETKKLMEKEKDLPKHIILEKMELIEKYVAKTEVVNQPKLKKQWDKKPKKRDGKQYQKWTIHLRNRVICKLKTEPTLLRQLHAALTHLSTYNEALAVNYLMNSTHVAEFLKQKLADDIKQHKVILKEKASFNDAEDKLLRYHEEVCQQLELLRGVTNDHLKTLRDILVELRTDLGDDVKGMIFVETRATAFALAKYITEELEMMRYRAGPFTGSKSSDSSEGMLEEEKTDTLKKYRKGEINLLVATSVGSEGIDVPDSNFIITYNYTGNEADIMQMSGRARRQDSTVTHISDQTIQRREETSLQKALLMARAFDRLGDMKEEDRHRKIREQQTTIKDTEIGSFFLENSVTKETMSFAIICWKCQAFAVHGNDVRIYTGQHRIVLDPDFLDRCVLEDLDETSRFKKRIIRCKECKTKWGTTFGVDEFEVPVLKVKAFLFVPGYTGGDLSEWKERKRFKTWGRVEFAIANIGKIKLLENLNNGKNDVITT
ncbi:antiviral innate immune response receptor RIG-I-like [Crassostrea angulata]|uniref:antiviral innate immune response receptor RIG-I-like n=1 Tax=Magallana angulata TaxID=2784310 RepID=UPI0022B1825E|nr:antiviral innate immune response receptor RIG-I-like [Crassostrea angulata]XP_052690672.1 antiviral innate immune response receptor RIG-I-like [Crassostrea angulata]